MRNPLIIVLLSSGCASAQPGSSGKALPYDMRQPTRVFELPTLLTEVSALTDVDDSTVACVHDESASVYFLSLNTGRIIDSVSFAGPADMEGLTRVGSEFFALRSDGLIHRLGDRSARLAVRDTFRLAIPNKNIEGLGFDDRTGLVLVSPKDFMKASKEGKDERVIYAIDPQATAKAPRVLLRHNLSVARSLARAARLRHDKEAAASYDREAKGYLPQIEQAKKMGMWDDSSRRKDEDESDEEE